MGSNANPSAISTTLAPVVPAVTALNAFKDLVMVSPTNIGYQPTKYFVDGQVFQSKDQAFLFHYEGEQKYSLSADITDHYIESNNALQDNIAIKPERFTTQGYIGELNDILPSFLQDLQKIANKLTALDAYAPIVSASALIAFNEAVSLYRVGVNAFNAANAAFNSVFGVGADPQNKQQTAFNLFRGYFRNRTLFNIQTPWRVMNNMAIETLTAVQDADTETMSTFEVTFKEMNFASTQNVAPSVKLGFGRNNAQKTSVAKNLGSSPGTPSTKSIGNVVAGIK